MAGQPPPADETGADKASVMTASHDGGEKRRDASDEKNGAKPEPPLPPPKRRSSLSLRKVPIHILLGPEADFETENSVSSRERQENDGDPTGELRFGGGWLLRKTCLRPNLRLRRQMMLSFGIVSTLTLCIMMVATITLSVSTGNSVKARCREPLDEWLSDNTATARYVTEAFAPKLPSNIVDSLHAIVRDRFEGYPDAQGYEDDSLVPFYDVTTKRQRYPLDLPMLPMDWQLDPNVDVRNADEQLQGRGHWFPGFMVSTASAFYGMQGTCDPEETNKTAATYYPNCTDAHNNMTTGVRILIV